MSSERHGKMRTSLLLTVLMVLMTQVGYLDVLNTWSEGDHTLDATTTASESGSASSQSNFTASAEGADLTVDVPMTNITFQYDANAVSGSSGSTPLVYTNDRMAAGSYHTCAILDTGDLKCWGRDSSGQLGDGGTTNTDTNAPSATSIDLGTGRTAVAVSTSGETACAILDNGDLKCWGRGEWGNLGDGTTTDTNAPSSTAVDLGSGRTALAVAVGRKHTCAILDNGDLKCWGRDYYGQLGDGGTNTDTTEPSATAINFGTAKAVAVSAGWAHTCAILDTGNVKCWGDDSLGQLGNGGVQSYSDYSATPVSVSLGSGRTAVAISVGDAHSCATLDNGDMKCWGSGQFGAVGDGGTNGVGSHQTSPVLVAGSNTWDTTTTSISMTNVTGASCSISPSLPTGLSIDSSTCTISGTPTVETSNTTYTVTAVISNVTYQGSVWLSTSPYGTITSAVEGAHLNLGEAMTPITLNYTVNANASPGSSGGS
ncbi:MAG: putative Ig domain-containing protein, partial [Candidatus Poseidoniaceae archaeon]